MEDTRCINGLLKYDMPDGRKAGSVCKDDFRFDVKEIELKNLHGGKNMNKINKPVNETKKSNFETCFSAKNIATGKESGCMKSLRELGKWRKENA